MSKKKITPIKRNGTIVGYLFWCPGCQAYHRFQVAPAGPPAWDFNGDMDNPTFSPSLGIEPKKDGGFDCHLLLRNGELQFLNDCKHSLAGNTVQLPDLPDTWQN